MNKGKLLLLTIIYFGITAFAWWEQPVDSIPTEEKSKKPPFLAEDEAWADSVLQSLTLEERIAQLFVVAAYSEDRPKHHADLQALVSTYNVGGLLFLQGGPARQINLTNALQAKAKTPLMICMDAEYGLAMRLDSSMKFPYQMTLGAMQSEAELEEMGRVIARQLKRLGAHVNLAPVVDVNNNAANPVINRRSFGENPDEVMRKAAAYMRGMESEGVISCAKHFPGHGDTDADSHKTLPVIHHTKARLDSVELKPFRALVKEGLSAMMVAHLYVPTLDTIRNRASTLSPPVVTDLLKNDLGFEGLVFSDALNMREVNAFYNPGMVDVKALLAGNDVLLFVEDVPTAIIEIKKAIERGELEEEEVNRRCKKLLKAKAWMELDNYQPVSLDGLQADLHNNAAKATKFKLIQQSLTVLRNEEELLPLKQVQNVKMAALAIGEQPDNAFHRGIDRYAPVDFFHCALKPTQATIQQLQDTLLAYDQVIISIHAEDRNPFMNFGVSKEAMQLVNIIADRQGVILDLFANPYSLRRFKGVEKVQALIVSYEMDEMVQDLSSQLIFGGIQAEGRLPVSVSGAYGRGSGLTTAAPIRMAYSYPEVLGIFTEDLAGIERIVNEGLRDKAYPGCQVLVAKEGHVIYQHSFGYHTYEKKRSVNNTDIYDLASITKIAASTSSMMRLADQGLVNMDEVLGTYLKDWVDSTDYAKINLREMMAHQAGLVSWIPFYVQTLSKGELKPELYNNAMQPPFDTHVAKDLYMNGAYKDTMIQRLIATPLNRRKKYLYSDLGYYFLQEIIRRKTGMTIDEYVASNFYQSMGLQRIGYKPKRYHNLDEIVPTEYDMAFRKQLVHGDVHDPGAAMMGGVGGHAGLFSNSNDLAVMMQMLVNGGEYGGVRYISDSTVKHFTASHFLSNNNRRGVGFDKPVRGDGGPTCACVSYDSYGHSGFTGTITWADPDQKVVYVFLSNRIYPDASNRKLISMGIRTRIQQVIYDAINKADARNNS